MTIQGDSSQEGLHCCPHPLCSAHFQNYNNYAFHLSVHKNTAGSAGHEETFGQKMAADRLCRELVMECLEKLGHNQEEVHVVGDNENNDDSAHIVIPIQ